MVVLSPTVGIYVQMAKASGDHFTSKLSTKLGSVHIGRITSTIMGKLTMGQVVHASRFRPMQTREASSRVVERKALFLPLVDYVVLIHPIVIQSHNYPVDNT